MPRLLKFFSAAGWKKRLLFECGLTLLVVKLALIIVSYRGLKQRCGAIAAVPGGPRRSPQEIAAAIRAVASLVPGATCLPQAITGQIVMARHGQPSIVRLGVTPDPKTLVRAHAWLVQGDRIVLGGSSAQLSEYEVLTDLSPVA